MREGWKTVELGDLVTFQRGHDLAKSEFIDGQYPIAGSIRNKPCRKAIGDRLKDPRDPLKMVIVRDMLLTGFDAPCLHTLYVDKPMTRQQVNIRSP